MRRAIAMVLLFPGWLYSQTAALEPLTATFDQPVFLTGAGDATARLFVVEQAGRVRVLDSPDAAQAGIFMDIRPRVLGGGERGLLGLAFHPEFASNRRLFVNYTRVPDGATVIAEYRSGPDGMSVGPDETVLMTIPQPYANHNGGMIAFGPDGYLYIATGDGGSGNDPENRAQNTGLLLGKILRIDVDHQTPGGPSYAIPPSNPLVGSAAREEIYATGLRNPWRFSFDRASGELWAGDVGQNAREEIDIVVAGGNYGWRVKEGTRCTGLGPGSCTDPDLVDPVTEYDNGSLGRCSVTGGYVYRGVRGSLPHGAYVFADYCSGEIFMLRDGVQNVLLDTSLNITSFGSDDADELYVVGQSGAILRIVNPEAPPPLRFDMAGRAVGSWAGLEPPTLQTGYARITPDPGGPAPPGLAFLGYAPAGTLVSEAALEVAAPVASGRIWAPAAAGTGIALVNPSPQPVTISFHFTGDDGNPFGDGTFDLPGRAQASGFLTGPPFDGPSDRAATFSVASTAPVFVSALGGETNLRGDFIMSGRPVSAPGVPPAPDRRWLPLLAAGAGWSSGIVLVNTTDQEISGRVTIRIPSDPEPDSSFDYAIPGRGSRTFAAGEPSGAARLGYATLDPDSGSPLPDAFTTVRGLTAGVATSTTSVPATAPVASARLFVESSGGFGEPGAIRQAVALVNTGVESVVVAYELLGPDGSPSGWSGEVPIPGNGHVAMFLDQLPGLRSMPAEFLGTLAIDAAPGAVAPTSLRARWNQRGEFLFSTTGPLPEPSFAAAFPFFPLGAGYRTTFVLLSGDSGASGDVEFFDSGGARLPPPLR